MSDSELDSSSHEDLNSENDIEEDEEEEQISGEDRSKIREKVSQMSFEDLIKLKQEVGSKFYNEAVFGSSTKRSKVKSFKRANKNRPREISSKIKPKNPIIVPAKKQISRDPRFDPLCGEFDQKTFKSNYKFVHNLRKKEKEQLEKELKETKDPQRAKNIKYLIQRIGNQIREQEKLDKQKQEEFEEKQEIRNKLKRGERPQFKKKSVKKLEQLIDKYEELKKSNKLQKHIQKRSKKLIMKDRKKLKHDLL